MDKFINVVALNIPYPANYGGVIDIYYKLKALHDCGVRIILHCFEYERPEAPELLDICEEVHYYKRHTGLRTNLTLLPYNVYSRKDPRLLAALLTNDYPILFEGLHSCYYLGDKRLRHRLKIFRECNIEHDYYRALVKPSGSAPTSARCVGPTSSSPSRRPTRVTSAPSSPRSPSNSFPASTRTRR